LNWIIARRRRKGVTLLEMMVVATLAGLMLGLVVPKMVSFNRGMTLDSAAQALVRDLGRARVEALKRNEPVSLKRVGDSAYQVRTEAPRHLPPGVTFVADGSVDSVRFASFGLVVAGTGALKVRAGSDQRRVVIRSSGHVRVE
jgi:type II secretion system protein H